MKCPECGYISFDHLKSCKKCGIQLSKQPHQNSHFKAVRKHTSKESLFKVSQPKSSFDEKPLEKNIKKDYVELSVNPIESDKRNPNSSTPSVFFQESEEEGEASFEDYSFSPEGTEGVRTKNINAGKNKSRAGFWIRSLAFIIDLILINILITIFTWTVKLGIITGGRIIEINPETLIDLREFLIIIIGVAIFTFYFIYFHGKTGQTPGKRLLHLKVIRTDGKPVGFDKAIERFFCYFISLIPLNFGFLLIAFNKEKQGLHDIITRTYVIKNK